MDVNKPATSFADVSYEEAMRRAHELIPFLREQAPVSFWPENEWLVPDEARRGNGYHAVTKYDDVLNMSKNPELFQSSKGIGIGDVTASTRESFNSMIVMDDPRHARLRKIVSAGFTPRTLKLLEESVQRTASAIVDDIQHKGECDFVTDIAAALPLRIICDMMGIPDTRYQYVFDRTNAILGASDPEYVPSNVDPVAFRMSAGRELAELIVEVGASKQGGNGDDLTTALVNAEVEGERLSAEELAGFFVLLLTAGNETTRNAIGHGLVLLCDNPEQREIWMNDFDAVSPTAVDEIVRWASPVVFMRRTATADTALSGTPISAGDKLLMFYLSANHDEGHFLDARRFDVRRDNRLQLGFGGPGPHFCLGAHLARREITVMYRELFRRLPDITVDGPPEYLRSPFIHGVKHLPCRFTPVA